MSAVPRPSPDTSARVGALVALSALAVCAVGAYLMVRSVVSTAVSVARRGSDGVQSE